MEQCGEYSQFRKAIQLSLVAVVIIGLLGISTEALSQSVRQVNVRKEAVAIGFNNALSAMEFHCNTYSGKRKDRSWFHPNDCFVRTPNGNKKMISLGETLVWVTKRRSIAFNIDDWNSREIKAVIDDNRVKVTMYMESPGTIRGECARKKVVRKKIVKCNLKVDRRVLLKNAKLEMWFMPTAQNGGISYTDAKAEFDVDISIPSKLCKVIKRKCKSWRNRVKKELEGAVKNEVAMVLNGSNVKKTVANAVARQIREKIRPGWTITKVNAMGNDFVLTARTTK